MVKIAIVEDERAYQEQFFAYVKKYEAESGEWKFRFFQMAMK